MKHKIKFCQYLTLGNYCRLGWSDRQIRILQIFFNAWFEAKSASLLPANITTYMVRTDKGIQIRSHAICILHLSAGNTAQLTNEQPFDS